jgi:hypothetical protein
MLKQAQQKLYFTFPTEQFALCTCDTALLPLIRTFQTPQFIPDGTEDCVNKTREEENLYITVVF